MPHSYSNLLTHIVYSTKNRRPLIDSDLEKSRSIHRTAEGTSQEAIVSRGVRRASTTTRHFDRRKIPLDVTCRICRPLKRARNFESPKNPRLKPSAKAGGYDLSPASLALSSAEKRWGEGLSIGGIAGNKPLEQLHIVPSFATNRVPAISLSV
jgi:hypothetical protein